MPDKDDGFSFRSEDASPMQYYDPESVIEAVATGDFSLLKPPCEDVKPQGHYVITSVTSTSPKSPR
jgi:hypothetical protein